MNQIVNIDTFIKETQAKQEALAEETKARILIAQSLRKTRPEIASRILSLLDSESAAPTLDALKIPAAKNGSTPKIGRPPKNGSVDKQALKAEFRKFAWRTKDETLDAMSVRELQARIEEYRKGRLAAASKRMKTIRAKAKTASK